MAQCECLGTYRKTNERHLRKRQKDHRRRTLIHQTYENKAGERKNRTVIEANEFMLFDPMKQVEENNNQTEA